MENSSDTIGNRTRDLPACGAVPEPTAPSRNVQRMFTILYSRLRFLLLYGIYRTLSETARFYGRSY
jgi:hypothetical protein